MPSLLPQNEPLGASGRRRRLDRSELFRTCPFSETEAHLRHRVLSYQKTD